MWLRRKIMRVAAHGLDARPERQQVRRKSPRTRVPKRSASTGTRSSMPWNIGGEVEVGGQPQRGEAVAA